MCPELAARQPDHTSGGAVRPEAHSRLLKRLVPQETKVLMVNTVCQWMRGRA